MICIICLVESAAIGKLLDDIELRKLVYMRVGKTAAHGNDPRGSAPTNKNDSTVLFFYKSILLEKENMYINTFYDVIITPISNNYENVLRTRNSKF